MVLSPRFFVAQDRKVNTGDSEPPLHRNGILLLHSLRWRFQKLWGYRHWLLCQAPGKKKKGRVEDFLTVFKLMMKMDYDQGLVLATYIARHLWLWYLSHTDHHTSTFFFWSAAGGYQEPGWRYKRNRLSSMRHMEKITWVSDSSYHLHSASRVPQTCTVCDRGYYI